VGYSWTFYSSSSLLVIQASRAVTSNKQAVYSRMYPDHHLIALKLTDVASLSAGGAFGFTCAVCTWYLLL
jgi:hypothetical protein